jgi:hypothetical protein
MVDSSKYSVINTNIRYIEIDGINYIEKDVRSNCKLGLTQGELFKYFHEYIKEITSTEINFPKIHSYEIKYDHISFICAEEGTNILEKYTLDELVFGKGRKALINVISELEKAVTSNLNIDPHIKNFVIKNDLVSFVDFSPPYTEEFFQLRLSIAKKEEKEIIKDNFDYFRPKNIHHHFLGDFLNVDPLISDKLLQEIFSLMKRELNLEQSFNDFFSISRKIRKTEDERLRRNIFLF